jgi:hypothetical protein
MADAPPLTILTVGIEKHYGYIRRQLQMIDALNPGADFRLLVVDNAAIETPQLQIDDPRCEVIAGIDPEPLPLPGRGSYHHAAALNLAIRKVETRYALVIDPDLFVVCRNWIAECMGHVRRRDLTFFGVPWHPRWYRKWRDFPCVHFLLIDLARAPAQSIDFTPAIVEDRDKDERPLAQWLKKHASLWHARALIETRRDTGWKLRQRFGKSRSELILPVVDVEGQLTRPKHLHTARGRRLEGFVPRRWRFLPAEGTWLRPEDAPGFAAEALQDLDPELFVWRGAPFAFHMRRNVRDRVFGRHDQSLEEPDLAAVLAETQKGGPWLGWRLDGAVR